MESFRNYEDECKTIQVVKKHYKMMRQNQTLKFVNRMEEKWLSLNHGQFTIKEAFDKLGSYVDASDPDATFPNILHGFQTAEAIRKDNLPRWFQLVGLIHDLGKMMFLWGLEDDGQSGDSHGQQWALGGDTWVVGCQIPNIVVYPEFNDLNPDMHDEKLNTKLGMYQASCGLSNLKFAFGHDEYLYHVLKKNGCKIPPQGLAMIRYHSCYPLHEHNSYVHFYEDQDYELVSYVQKFNKYDLYTKSDNLPNVNELWPYYENLINEYCPGKLSW